MNANRATDEDAAAADDDDDDEEEDNDRRHPHHRRRRHLIRPIKRDASRSRTTRQSEDDD